MKLHRPDFKRDAALSDRERFCLIAYLFLYGKAEDRDGLAARVYNAILARTPSKDVPIDKLTELYFKRPNVVSFLEENAPIVGERLKQAYTLAQETPPADPGHGDAEEHAADTEGLSAAEIAIAEIERLKEQASDLDDKLKCIKMASDIRYKNRDQVQDTKEITRLYAPVTCEIECPLYKEALEKIAWNNERKIKTQNPQRNADKTRV